DSLVLLHTLNRRRDERGARLQDVDIAAVARQRFRPILITSLTTAVGLASLVAAQTPALRRFGIAAALGVLLAYLITVLVLPGALKWVPRPPARLPRAGTAATRLESWLFGMTRWVLDRHRLVLLATLMVVAGAALSARLLNVDSALLDQFAPDDPLYRSTEILDRKLGGVRPLQVQLSLDSGESFLEPKRMRQLAAVSRFAAAQPGVRQVLSPTSLLTDTRQLLLDADAQQSGSTGPWRGGAELTALADLLRHGENNALSPFLSQDGQHARLQLRFGDIGAQATLRIIHALETEVQRRFSAAAILRLSGDAYTSSVGLQAIIQDLLTSLFVALVLIFLLLTALFRNWRLGLASIPPNLLPLVGTMAYMQWRGIPLNAATVIIFSISLGLAVDGSIHILARVQEETKRGITTGPALLRAARHSGRAIVISGLALMAGFSVLLASRFVPVRHFGELIALTVGMCLLSTLVVQPAVLRAILGFRLPRMQKS
ncbi:MAG: efflux RND transporter permease subunit, partial [Polyangiales bacterium]